RDDNRDVTRRGPRSLLESGAFFDPPDRRPRSGHDPGRPDEEFSKRGPAETVALFDRDHESVLEDDLLAYVAIEPGLARRSSLRDSRRDLVGRSEKRADV